MACDVKLSTIGWCQETERVDCNPPSPWALGFSLWGGGAQSPPTHHWLLYKDPEDCGWDVFGVFMVTLNFGGVNPCKSVNPCRRTYLFNSSWASTSKSTDVPTSEPASTPSMALQWADTPSPPEQHLPRPWGPSPPLLKSSPPCLHLHPLFLYLILPVSI